MQYSLTTAAGRQMEQAWEQAGHAPLPAIPPPVICWRLIPIMDGNTQAQRTFGGGEDGLRHAIGRRGF